MPISKKTSPKKKGVAMSEANKTLVRRGIDETINSGNFAHIDELLSANYIYREPTVGEKRGREGFRQLITMYRTAFPDVHLNVEEQIAEGNTVVTRWTAKGTHRGELFGVPPAGKQVTVQGILISHIENGRISEEIESYDALGMMRQLGAAPVFKAAA